MKRSIRFEQRLAGNIAAITRRPLAAIWLFALWLALLALPANAQIIGPVYPPPLGATLSSSAAANSGAISRPGGVTWTYSALGLPSVSSTWWGAAPGGVKQDFDGNPSPPPMVFASSTANTIRYTGTTAFLPSGPSMFLRFTMTFTGPGSVQTASSAGIDPGVGAVFKLDPGATGFAVNLLFEASYDNVTWAPSLDVYDAQPNKPPGSALSSFDSGFYYNNNPPTITAVPAQVIQPSTATAALAFTVGDAETLPASLAVTAISDNQTSVLDTNIVLGGSGATRSVTVTATSTPGTAHILLKVSDGYATATTSFAVRVNAPPLLTANTTLSATQHVTATLTPTQLSGSDPDSAAPVTFVIGGQPHNGTLFLDGIASPVMFAQDAIANGRVTYKSDTCAMNDDFQFKVEDVDGGFANDPFAGPGPTSYSFGISIANANTAPSANGASLSVGLGASVSSILSASSADCGPPAITFTLVTSPLHGTVSAFNASSGAFTYMANPGYTGADSFTFTATTYGTQVSAPATIALTIQNQPPVALPATMTLFEGSAANGTLLATDPDQPPQALTFALVTPPLKGTVNLTAATGAYTYMPAFGAIGDDMFTFTASDGILTSTPATVSVHIQPVLHAGEVLLTDNDPSNHTGAVIVFNPVNGQTAALSRDPLLTNLFGIAVEADGHVLVSNVSNVNGSVLRIDPATGAASVLSSAFANPVGLTVETNGNILVADPALGAIVRINPTTGAQVGASIVLGAQTAPAGIAIAGDGSLRATDVAGVFGAPTDNKYWSVAANGTTPVTISHGGDLNAPVDLALADDGGAWISTSGPLTQVSGAPSNIVHVSSAGVPTLLTSNGNLLGATGVAAASSALLYVASNGNASIVGVGTAGGSQSVLSSGGLLHQPFGIVVVPTLPGVDLAVTIGDGSSFVAGGSTLTYTVLVQNLGTEAALAAHLTSTMSGNLGAISWTCVASTGAICAASGSGGLVDTVNIPIGGQLTYTLHATVVMLPEAPATVTVSIAPASGVLDTDLLNNTSTDTDNVGIFANGFD